MPAADTTIDMARRQRQVLASKSPQDRVAMVVEMFELVRELAIEGIRRRHPGIGDEQMRLRLIERLHGRAIAAAVEASISARRGD